MKKDISIIIPTYNRANLLADAIASCMHQSSDSKLNLEIIVVDDCSTDKTRLILNKYDHYITTIHLSENKGQCAARNEGLKSAAGRYLKFLDSDDVLEEGSILREFDAAERSDADMMLTGWGRLRIDSEGYTVPGTSVEFSPPSMHPIPDSVLLGRAVPISAALYRTRYVDGLEWDTGLAKLADWDWFCRAALRGGKIVTARGTSFWIREHDGIRVTDSTMLVNARAHHVILRKIEAILVERGELTLARRRRLAQYFYKELLTLCRYDRREYGLAVDHIFELDPDFHPVDEERRRFMRLLGRVLGIRRTVPLHAFLKTLYGRGRVD